MAVKKIEAFEVNGKIFTDEKEAKKHDTKSEIVKTLSGLDIAFSNMKENLSVSDLDTFTLEELRRVGRMADELLK
jgi:hypothetical protein